MTIIKANEVPLLDRGGGVTTIPLITHRSDDTALITTGISTYPVGGGAPLHVHNCDEQVTLLEGRGEVEIDGAATPLVPYDSTYIQAGVPHLFRNTGDEPMRILWIYPTQDVTRTMLATGETVTHLSDADLMG
ncbi:MAG TPA: cupin domain-containing protein [Gaiellaceae bacterium]|nr:cupin domain-containing protein [Gaiellaceae bacterium]